MPKTIIQRRDLNIQAIVSAAKHLDVQALQQALSMADINESDSGLYGWSAAAQLAWEHDIPAVNFLIKHGAKLDHIAFGAALGGHEAYVNELLSMHGEEIDISEVAFGAAMGGYFARVEALQNQYPGAINIKEITLAAALGGHQDYIDTLLTRFGKAIDINDIVDGLAQGGHVTSIQNLKRRYGKDIDIMNVANAAGLGGHTAFVNELITQYRTVIDINYVALNAARGGHKALVENLLAQHGENININDVIRGAAQGVHKKYVDQLLCLHGEQVNINEIIQGAAEIDNIENQAYVEELLDRYGNANKLYPVVASAALHNPVSQNKISQLKYLSAYSPKHIPALIRSFQRLQILIHKSTQEQALAISRHIRQDKLSFAAAFTRTQQECQGMLYLLMMLGMQQDKHRPKVNSPISGDLWIQIFSFITPVPIKTHDYNRLSFVIARSYLSAQLNTYQSGFGLHKDRALSFFKAVSVCHDKENMKKEINQQVEVLQGRNPYQLMDRDQVHKVNPYPSIPDIFYGIVGFWKELYDGETVLFGEEHLSGVKRKLG